MKNKHYIFGYGSLISSSSRRITGIAGDSVAVRVNGLERTWVGWKGTDMRAVAARPVTDACSNGVLFEVPESELFKFDERETHYVRTQLDLSQIDYVHGNQSLITAQCNVWVYLYDHQGRGLSDEPIVQSYLDVILLGCQEITPTFAIEFIEQTLNWDVWHDDRAKPVYPRAQLHDAAHQLDQLLAKYVPHAFIQRRLVQ